VRNAAALIAPDDEPYTSSNAGQSPARSKACSMPAT
jgi:hypothetical protein